MTVWWRQWWVWLSALVFLVVSWVMYKYGAGYYGMISKAARHLIEARETSVHLSAAQKEGEYPTTT